MKDMKARLIDRGFTAEEIDANPEVLKIMWDHLMHNYQKPPYTRKAIEGRKLNSRIRAQINIPIIKKEVESLDPAYLTIKLKAEGFTHHQISKYPELIELKRAKILEERLKKNAK